MKLSSKIIYYIGIILVCIYSWDFFSNIIEINYNITKGIVMLLIILFIFNIFNCKYTKKEMLIIFIILPIILYSAMKGNELKLFISYLAIISSKNISNKNIINVLTYTNLLMIIIHSFLTISGIYPETQSFYTYVDNISRHTFNLRHPNYLAALIFWTTAGLTYLKFDKKRSYLLILSIISMFIMYYLTYSRTTLLLYILLMVIIILRNNHIKENIMKISKVLMLVIILISIYLSTQYLRIQSASELITKLNYMMSGRLYLSSKMFNYLGITVFGRQVYTIVDSFVVDSLYTSFFIQYGIIHFVILLISFIRFPVKKENYIEYMLFLIVLITAISEKYVINIAIAFPLLFIKDYVSFVSEKEIPSDIAGGNA